MENNSNLKQTPIGPPGTETDVGDYETDRATQDFNECQRENSSKSTRRRSPSDSPLPTKKRLSQSRGRRTPSPVSRRRRSPSPRDRRPRYRDYSPPDRRRYDGHSRRSPDRRRSPMRDRDRDRDRRNSGRGYRGRSRSRTRSPVSPRRSNNNRRWSPKQKPASPPGPQPQLNQPPPTAQYGVMPPPPMYSDTYAAAYNQPFVQPPPPQGFVQHEFTMAPPPAPGFTYHQTAPNWGVPDNYAQANWMPQAMPEPAALQMQQPPPPPQATQMSQPPPVTPQVIMPANIVSTASAKVNAIGDAAPGTVEQNMVHDAVAQEAENQRDELKKQRSSYLKKTTVLKKELKMLKEQRKDLNSGNGPLSPTTKGFIDENEKLQAQIQKKLSTIENVIDMLTGIIGEENIEKETEGSSSSPPKAIASAFQGSRKKKSTKSTSTSDSSSNSTSSSSSSTSTQSSTEDDDDDSSPERLKNKAIESMKAKQKEANKKELANERKLKEDLKKVEEQNKFNYVFYDPEMHWCRTCEIFPKTAKDYLNHLHSKEHLERENVETPWHAIMVNDQYPTYINAPTRRTPIRGLTFFVPATAWFCKLCNVWMGDLHCASTHLKSQQHSNKYNSFLEKNPHFEVDWLADRQRMLNMKRLVPLPQQITSVSTTASENVKKSKKDEEKPKKRKKKSSDKKKKEKKKRSKKRKKVVSTPSSSSDESSSACETTKPSAVVKDINNSNSVASIRVAMRKQGTKMDDNIPPPPPPMKTLEDVVQPQPQLPPSTQPQPSPNVSGPIGKWTVTQEGNKQPPPSEEENKRDDAIISQWNTVQPVISESEKKLLEELKGKLKNKPRDEIQNTTKTSNIRAALDASDKEKERGVATRKDRGFDSDQQRRHTRSRSRGRYGGGGGRSRTPRSRSRSRSRGRGRGGYRGGRGGRRSRSRSRGRYSPIGWRGGRRRRSRSRSLRRRSRSFERRRRGGSRSSRSRSRSVSANRVEKPVVRHPEFRPRVPEKEKEKKPNEVKEKKEVVKKPVTKAKTGVESGKKLPFIGKMPVFKKQTSGCGAEGMEQREGTETYEDLSPATQLAVMPSGRVVPPPTAAQIQMAMMEDVYGNAPPFHPDAAMIDYDDLMPDPVQFVNIMGQAPPPPPPAPEEEDDKDMLPPGIDEPESEDFLSKPISDAPIPPKGALPKDFEEALNIIFPGEKKSEDGDNEKKVKVSGQTQIIVDEPVMPEPEDLAREGIHMVTIKETSTIGMDEASQVSMNEPLIFGKRGCPEVMESLQQQDASSQNALDIDLASIEPPPTPPSQSQVSQPVEDPDKSSIKDAHGKPNDKVDKNKETENLMNILTADIPIPESNEDLTAVVYDLDDIPQPPPSPTESEKMRRQEELDDLAMLGIDASDMAAQCM